MRKLWHGLLIAIGLCVPAAAQQAAYVWTALGYQQISPVTTPSILTVPNGARMAMICAETNAVRYRDDGTAPTATVGMLIPITSPTSIDNCIMYSGPLPSILFQQVTSPATLDVSYYR